MNQSKESNLRIQYIIVREKAIPITLIKGS